MIEHFYSSCNFNLYCKLTFLNLAEEIVQYITNED